VSLPGSASLKSTRGVETLRVVKQKTSCSLDLGLDLNMSRAQVAEPCQDGGGEFQMCQWAPSRLLGNSFKRKSGAKFKEASSVQ